MGKAKTAALEPAAAAENDDALLALLAAGLRLQSNDALWKVSGNTLAHRTLLRDAGGTWNRLDQCWEFAGDDPSAKLAAALEAIPAPAGHNSGEPAAPKPHYHGHRARVRERVLKAGIDSLPDYELLELLLFYAIDRIDTKPLAKRLLERFGTLGDVFAAEPAQLREFEIDQRTLVMFRAVREAGRRLAERKVKDMPVLTNWQQLIDYCHAALAHEKTEQFRIYPLPKEWQTDATQQSHFSVVGMKVDGKVWVKNSDRSQVLKLDPETGQYENLGSLWRMVSRSASNRR